MLQEQLLPTPDLEKHVNCRTDLIQAALAGGDDYELCFTFDPQRLDEVRTLSAAVDAQCCVIGVIKKEPQLLIERRDGTVEALSRDGYRHF